MRRKEELKKRSEAVHAAAAFTPPATEFLSDTDIEAGRMSPSKDSGALPEAPLSRRNDNIFPNLESRCDAALPSYANVTQSAGSKKFQSQ